MGVSAEYFVFYGLKMPYGVFADCRDFIEIDHLLKYDNRGTKYYVLTKNETPGELFCLTDGMNGDYSCFGVLIGRYGDYRWGESRDINLSLSIEDLQKYHEKYLEFVKELEIEVDEQPTLHILRHYS